MIKLDYWWERVYDGFERNKYSTLDIGPTVFARYKIGQQFFAQLEYEYGIFTREETSGGRPVIIDGKVQKTNLNENFLYIGAGYGGGYPFGSYVSLHYNILDDNNSLRSIPFDYRIGFVWNF